MLTASEDMPIRLAAKGAKPAREPKAADEITTRLLTILPNYTVTTLFWCTLINTFKRFQTQEKPHQ